MQNLRNSVRLIGNLGQDPQVKEINGKQVATFSMATSSMHKGADGKKAGEVNVIAGEFKDVKGPAQVFSPVHIYDLHLNPGGEIQFTLPASYNTAFVVIDGDVKLNHSHHVPHNHYAQLANSAGDIHIKASEKSVILLLSGEPLNEPYVSYGPFVMNTQEEITQAIKDYNEGKFGFLAD